MLAPGDIAAIASCCSFVFSALIISALIFLACKCKQAEHVQESQSRDPSKIHESDKLKCNWYWALATSVTSIIMCLLYGGALVGSLVSYYGKDDIKVVEALRSHSRSAISIVSRFFLMFIIILFLVYPLVTLRNPCQGKKLVYIVLAAAVGILSCIGVAVDDWYYLMNMIAYILAIVVIWIIRRYFYDDIIHNNGQKESQPIVTSSQETGIDAEVQQVLLLNWQWFGMGLCCFLQACLSAYHLYRWKEHYHPHDVIYYVSLAAKAILFCILIVLINVCIWLSFKFAQSWYRGCVCCSCCHEILQAVRRNAILSRGENDNGAVPINTPSYSSMGGGALTEDTGTKSNL